MIRIFNRFCRECQSDRPVKYYIHEWQKKFEHLFPFSYCDKCANRKKDIMLYDVWMAIVNAVKYVNGKEGKNE